MKIGEFTGKINSFIQSEKSKNKSEDKFENILTGFISKVNEDQFKSKQVTDDFINGKGVELHEVMIAGEKAKTSLDLLMEIRNKAVDMYKEITRMQ